MIPFLISAALATFTVTMIVSWLRRQFTRTVEDATDSVYDALSVRPPHTTITRVSPRNAYPLSEPMIKELAVMDGHNYRGRGTTGNNLAALLFTQRPRTVESPFDV